LGNLSDLYRGELYLKDDRPDKSPIAEGEQRETRDGKKPGSGTTEKLMHSWQTSCKITGMREPLGVTTTTGKRALDAARTNSYKQCSEQPSQPSPGALVWARLPRGVAKL